LLIFLVKECFICGRCFGDHNLECDLDKTPLNATLLGLPLVKNKYRLDRRVSTEPIGATYLAYDIENRSTVTLKIILMEYLRNGFQKYSRILEAITQISHPNIIPIFDYGKNDETYFYLVMEYVEGKTLEAILKKQTILPLDQAVNYINLLCEAVNAIYDVGQMYQDIRLTNIVIDNNSNLKLYNLGFSSSLNAKLSGAISDLPYYISPEQCKNAEIDERSEVYSIGILLYQLLTGKQPFVGQNYVSIAEQHIRQVPNDPRTVRPEIPSNIATIILRALEKDPDRRFQTVLAFANLLCQALRQVNKGVSSTPLFTSKPSTEKLAVTLPKILPKNLSRESQNIQNILRESKNILKQEVIIDEEDVNRTIEVTRFADLRNEDRSLSQAGVQPVENDSSLSQQEVQDLLSDWEEIEQTPVPKPIKRQPTINIAQGNDWNNLISNQENTQNTQNTQSVSFTDNQASSQVNSDDILANISSKLAEKTYPLPSEMQDGTKPLPPELQALFNVSQAQVKEEKLTAKENLTLVNQINQQISQKADIESKDNLIKDTITKGDSTKSNSLILSPTQVSYFYADKLVPTYKSSQYQRKMHNGGVVEREAIASLVLILAIFSLRRRKCLKIIPLETVAPVLQKKLIVAEDDKLVLQIINAGVKPLDALEQTISKSFGRLNAVSLYGLYQYFFVIADEQKIAVAELINDAIADDLAEKKLLKSIPRDTKTVLEPGGSIRTYSVEAIEIDNYLSQYNELLKLIEGLKQETLPLADGKPIQVYNYMLGYYKGLFCQHSYTFER